MFGLKNTGPATSSSLNATWLRITGRDKWLRTTATVYSCEYGDRPEQANSSAGYYTVVYSYSADGERYTGKFVDFGKADESYFKRKDAVDIRYDPRQPAKSYYPGLRTQVTFRVVCAGFGAAAGCTVMAIFWWTHRGR